MKIKQKTNKNDLNFDTFYLWLLRLSEVKKVWNHWSGLICTIQEATVHPNEIVPRQGPPSVDYEESDRKVNQSLVNL